MKFLANGHKRLLSMLLSLVLLVSLVPVIGLPASAEGPNLRCTAVTKVETHSPSGCLKTMTISFEFINGSPLADANGQFAVHNGAYSTKYTGSPASAWPDASTIQATDPTFIAFGTNSVEDYEWTHNQYQPRTDSIDVTFGDNIIKPGETYYLYLWTFSSNYGVYPEQFFAKIRLVGGELQVVYSQDEDFHTHQWKSSPIDGNGTREASTTISCTGPDCNAPMQVDVSLTASDVTLPGNVFSAKLTVETTENPAVALLSTRAASLPLPGLPKGLEISEPVYKYSATGSGYDPIDPAGFTPKAGYYQASVQIRDVNRDETVADLAVKYTVSDPAVTAATGDNRPIELMILGMAFFCAMAAGAFVLDGRRKVR